MMIFHLNYQRVSDIELKMATQNDDLSIAMLITNMSNVFTIGQMLTGYNVHDFFELSKKKDIIKKYIDAVLHKQW